MAENPTYIGVQGTLILHKAYLSIFAPTDLFFHVFLEQLDISHLLSSFSPL